MFLSPPLCSRTSFCLAFCLPLTKHRSTPLSQSQPQGFRSMVVPSSFFGHRKAVAPQLVWMSQPHLLQTTAWLETDDGRGLKRDLVTSHWKLTPGLQGSCAPSWSPMETPHSLAFVCPGFPWKLVGKESAYNGGHPGLIPGLGRSPGGGKGPPFQYSGLENSVDCIAHGVAKSRTRVNDFHFHFHQWWQLVDQPGKGSTVSP